MLCEMCGKDVEEVSLTRIEGSTLRLCPDCQRFGVLVSPPPSAPTPTPTAPPSTRVGGLRPVGVNRGRQERDLFQEIPDLELAADWSKRIRVAREHLAWTPEDLGKKLNEKKSVVLKMESGGFRPPDAMVRKIEHLLRIRLRADPETSAPS